MTDPAPARAFAALPATRRLALLRPVPCRPLPDVATATSLALARFDASWRAYRSITPTLYPIGPGGGRYATLGRLRRRWRLDWDFVDAAADAFAAAGAEGFLLAAEGAGGAPPRSLFALQGHHHGERHHGALELATLRPFEGVFRTEFDDPEGWRWRRTEARSNDGFASD